MVAQRPSLARVDKKRHILPGKGALFLLAWCRRAMPVAVKFPQPPRRARLAAQFDEFSVGLPKVGTAGAR
jgi:hypothetical protein